MTEWIWAEAMRRLMMLTGALLMVSSTAQSQVDVATDTELRVAYCHGALEQYQTSNHITGPNSLLGGMPADSRLDKALREEAQLNSDRRARLLGYLKARGLFSVRSSAAISGANGAKHRGRADGVELQAVREACVSKCIRSTDVECTPDCAKENPAWLAFKRCQDNNPLPY